MKPPFLGAKIVTDVPLDEVEPLLDREALFASRWQFRQGADASAWEALKSEKVLPIYGRMMSAIRANAAAGPAMAYGHFECRRIGNGLLVAGERREFRFDFPRERRSPNRCVADFFGSGFASFQLVTVGAGISKMATEMFAQNKYSDSFYLKGIASELAEAAAKYCHAMIRREMGVAEGIGERFSPGYPAFPDLLDQKKIFQLLDASRIGVAITETCQLIPEHSASAIVSMDERAAWFRP